MSVGVSSIHDFASITFGSSKTVVILFALVISRKPTALAVAVDGQLPFEVFASTELRRHTAGQAANLQI
jgi:hypothetical protein